MLKEARIKNKVFIKPLMILKKGIKTEILEHFFNL